MNLIRILTVGLELACDGGSRRENDFPLHGPPVDARFSVDVKIYVQALPVI